MNLINAPNDLRNSDLLDWWESHFPLFPNICQAHKRVIRILLAPYGDKKVQEIALLSQRICARTEDFQDYLPKIDLLSSVQVARLVAGERKRYPYTNRNPLLSVALAVDREGNGYVFFSPKKQLGHGTFKDVYLAFMITAMGRQVFDVVPAAQYVPAKGDKQFAPGILLNMYRFSLLGSNCLKIYRIFKSLSTRNCAVDEMVVAEYWPRGNLKSVVPGLSPGCEALSSLELLRVAKDLVLGLSEVHSLGFAHGDVKPSNSLFRGHLWAIKACLADPDLMRLADNELLSIATCMYYGSPGFTPPEMLENAYSLSGGGPAADCYALGQTLYMLIIGQFPWYDDLCRHFKMCATEIDALKMQREQFYSEGIESQAIDKWFVESIKQKVFEDGYRRRIIDSQKSIHNDFNPHASLKMCAIKLEILSVTFGLMHPDPEKRFTVAEAYALLDKINRQRAL